jgi:hypothetical protein
VTRPPRPAHGVSPCEDLVDPGENRTPAGEFSHVRVMITGVRSAAMDQNLPQSSLPPPPSPRKLSAKVYIWCFGFLAAAFLIVALVSPSSSAGGSGQPAPVRVLASTSRLTVMVTQGGDPYAMGYAWGKHWWDSLVGAPIPDAASLQIIHDTCAEAANGTLDPGLPSEHLPDAVIPEGGQEQWVEGCAKGYSGQ